MEILILRGYRGFVVCRSTDPSTNGLGSRPQAISAKDAVGRTLRRRGRSEGAFAPALSPPWSRVGFPRWRPCLLCPSHCGNHIVDVEYGFSWPGVVDVGDSAAERFAESHRGADLTALRRHRASQWPRHLPRGYETVLEAGPMVFTVSGLVRNDERGAAVLACNRADGSAQIHLLVFVSGCALCLRHVRAGVVVLGTAPR